MKVLLITIVDNINFGTYLQAFSTVKKLSEYGCEVRVVDYIRPYLSSCQVAKSYLSNSHMSWPLRIAYCVSYLSLFPLMLWHLKRFLIKNVSLTRRYTSYSDFLRHPETADLYLTGSDQVWNTKHNSGIDDFFFWKGIEGRKASYGASIGLNSFTDEEKPLIKELLSSYESVSVRESFGVSVLENIGIKSCQVLDPTLLITGDEWLEMSKKSSFRKTENYLLIYGVEPERSDFVYEQARNIAKENGLKTYLICPSFKFKRRCRVDRIINFSTVEDFLAIMGNADYIVACSFHGTAFAINFNKQFISISPSHFNTRVNSLLKLLNIEYCYVDSPRSYNQLPSVDYEKVNQLLDMERSKSNSYIRSILKMS